MERYIGIDVHAASCTVAVISEKGRKLRDFPVETNGQALIEAVRMTRAQAPCVRRRASKCLAVRDPEPACGRDRCCRSHAEPRSEERQTRCVWGNVPEPVDLVEK